MEQEQANFKGWCVVELFGRQREVGYVTTQYFGTVAMFQVDVPGLPEQEVVLDSPEYGPGPDSLWLPKGTRVRRGAREGKSRLIGPGAVYAMNPCSEEVAMKMLGNGDRRIIKVVEMPAGMKSLPEPELDDFEVDEEDREFSR